MSGRVGGHQTEKESLGDRQTENWKKKERERDRKEGGTGRGREKERDLLFDVGYPLQCMGRFQVRVCPTSGFWQDERGRADSSSLMEHLGRTPMKTEIRCDH